MELALPALSALRRAAAIGCKKAHHPGCYGLIITISIIAALVSASPVRAVQPRVSVQSLRASSSGICGNAADQLAGFRHLLDLATSTGASLTIDCPVNLHIGDDPSRTIFLNDGVNILISNPGSITVDNGLVPAFVIANSDNVEIEGGHIYHEGPAPLDYKIRTQDGKVSSPGSIFNDVFLKAWLIKYKHLDFIGGSNPYWAGPTDMTAIFYISGSSAGIRIFSLDISVAPNSNVSTFIPVVFALVPGFKSGSSVTKTSTVNTPQQIQFTNIILDGYYMGWQGTASEMSIKDITAYRYGDLQAANGEHAGGVGKWFAPPHLIYLNYPATRLASEGNNNVVISDIRDLGLRKGIARDQPGTSGSGFAASLKIQLNNSYIENYTSSRPDGLLDLLPSNNVYLKNIIGHYNSDFLNQLYPGVRFPDFSGGRVDKFVNVTVDNLDLTDLAEKTVSPPIIGSNNKNNYRVQFSNVNVHVQQLCVKGGFKFHFDGMNVLARPAVSTETSCR